MERSLAHIEKILWVRPIVGADKIELCGILGWQCVCGKGEFKEGDLCVYHEIDSRVPVEEEVYSFLSNVDGKIKTRKFRGQLSQGLALALNKYSVDLGKYGLGDDVTELLGIKKIQTDEERRLKEEARNPKLEKARERMKKFTNSFIGKPLMRHEFTRNLVLLMFGINEKKLEWPDFVSKTDEVRIENIPEMLNNKTELICTEKVDGTSSTYFVEKKGGKYNFGLCSRNVRIPYEKEKKYLGGVVYLDVCYKYHIKDVLINICKEKKAKRVVLQGETIGKVQGNPYQIEGVQFYAFNLKIDGVKINSIEGMEILKKHNIDWVPIISKNFVCPNTMEEMKLLAEGKSVINPNVDREGCVYRSADNTISFKNVSNSYLLKKQ